MVLVWILAALVLLILALAYISIARSAMPLEPALAPGDLGEVRDPEYFALQEQCFKENGFEKAGDFFWHAGLSSIGMRIFRATTGEAYGWAYEEALAGTTTARHSVSILSEFTDGTMLDTTSTSQASLLDPPWFHRETGPPDTELLLRRHGERRARFIAEGRAAVLFGLEDLPEAIRRNERRLSEHQVEKGRMKIVRGKLYFTTSGALRALARWVARMLGSPFRRQS